MAGVPVALSAGLTSEGGFGVWEMLFMDFRLNRQTRAPDRCGLSVESEVIWEK
jgi:hypothetical protein